MKKYLLLLILLLGLKTSNLYAAVIPENLSIPATVNISLPDKFTALSIKQIQKLVGRKLTLKEKIGIKILQWKMKKVQSRAKPDEKSNSGKIAQIFGIIGLVSILSILLVPSLFFFSGIMALLALIFGYKGQRENPGDRKARTAITLGWITIALLMAFILAVLIAFAGSSWSFG